MIAIERNVESAFWAVGSSYPGAELLESRGLRRYATDVRHPMGNIVVSTELDDADPEILVREVLADYQRRNSPMMWFVGPHSRPTDLGAVLEAAGFSRLYETPGMAADLAVFDTDLHLVEGARIVEVDRYDTLEAWRRTLGIVFNLSHDATRLFSNIPAKHGFGASAPFRMFIAYLDGEPVAVSGVYFADGVAGIYCVGTKPEARRRGIGSAITARPMLEAKKLGYRYATLQSSDSGLHVYERLGFREYCRFQRYGFNLGAAES